MLVTCLERFRKAYLDCHQEFGSFIRGVQYHGYLESVPGSVDVLRSVSTAFGSKFLGASSMPDDVLNSWREELVALREQMIDVGRRACWFSKWLGLVMRVINALIIFYEMRMTYDLLHYKGK